MAFPGFLNWWATSRQKRLTDRHSRYNQMRPAPRQRKTGAQANQDTQAIVSDA